MRQLNLRVAGPVDREQLKGLAVISGVQSVIPIPLYDTVTLAAAVAASTTQQFFAHTKGANGIAITNMEQPNQLISGKVQVITEIALNVSTPTGSQVAGSLDDFLKATHGDASYTFKINNVEYAQGPLKELIGGKFFGFGAGPYVAANIGGNGRYKLSPAVLLPTQVGFSLEINYAAAFTPAAAVSLVMELRGQQLRLASA